MFKKLLQVVCATTIVKAQDQMGQDPGEEDDQSQAIEGKCPEVVNTLNQRGEKFIPEKLLGLWKPIYAEASRKERSNCWQTKFQKFEA